MAYKSWESLDIREDCIREWASGLNPNTARNYVYYFLHYLNWVKEKEYWNSASEMIEDCRKLSSEERYKHLDILLSYIKSLKSGVSDRRNRFLAVRNFYDYHRVPLPRPSKADVSRYFRPSELDKKRAINLKPLEVEEVRKIILNAPQPYKAIFMVIFQSAMGLCEFELFNTASWKKVVRNLDKEGPVRVDLVRGKTSRQTVKKYYTYIGEDAKTLIKEWLKMRPETKTDLFLLPTTKTKGNGFRLLEDWFPTCSGKLQKRLD